MNLPEILNLTSTPVAPDVSVFEASFGANGETGSAPDERAPADSNDAGLPVTAASGMQVPVPVEEAGPIELLFRTPVNWNALYAELATAHGAYSGQTMQGVNMVRSYDVVNPRGFTARTYVVISPQGEIVNSFGQTLMPSAPHAAGSSAGGGPVGSSSSSFFGYGYSGLTTAGKVAIGGAVHPNGFS